MKQAFGYFPRSGFVASTRTIIGSMPTAFILHRARLNGDGEAGELELLQASTHASLHFDKTIGAIGRESAQTTTRTELTSCQPSNAKAVTIWPSENRASLRVSPTTVRG